MASHSLPSQVGDKELPENIFAVILAGGSGTRFWPKSRRKSPKQLCKLGGSDLTMIEITLARLDGFIPPARRVIVTHKDQVAETKKIVGDRCLTIIAEPEARNTANALAIAAIEIEQIRGKNDAILISLHADHVVQKVDVMLKAFRVAVDVSNQGYLTLIGIVPRYPETGYGYIERGNQLDFEGAYRVASFREKPDQKTAEHFLSSKNFLWNAGLFVFPVDLFLREMEQQLPKSINELRQLLTQSPEKSFCSVKETDFARVYSRLPKISVDNAVLEVSKNVSVVEADMGWQDVGSWDALGQCFSTDSQGNFVQGDILAIESNNCTFDTDGPLIAAIGLNDLVVVCSKGSILVCPKNRAQDVKLVVDRLSESGRKDLL